MKRYWVMAAAATAAVAVGLAVCLSGCANLGYYWQSAQGHLRMINAARPVNEWLAEESTPPVLRQRLALSQRIRRFAATELQLPDNASYTRYADLHRGAVVWNVVAAPAYSLALKTWCFPVMGCVSYRGYFDEAQARAEAAGLAAQGLETSVYPVPAYSTLGWMNWAGGDPLLNTFIQYPEGELARLIFHELAHQVAYAQDDTMFNESFATAVERLGSARWLASQASESARRDHAESESRRRQFRALALATRQQLKVLYEQAEPAGATKEAAKQAIMARFREQYAVLRAGWPGDAARWRALDHWVAQANNASLGAQAAYDELVPQFEALFERKGGNWRQFYDEVKQLARLPRQERLQRLKEIHGV